MLAGLAGGLRKRYAPLLSVCAVARIVSTPPPAWRSSTVTPGAAWPLRVTLPVIAPPAPLPPPPPPGGGGPGGGLPPPVGVLVGGLPIKVGVADAPGTGVS